MEPEDLYTVVFEPWALEDLEPFVGYTPTGRTVIKYINITLLKIYFINIIINS
jgi:hypothetical protein